MMSAIVSSGNGHINDLSLSKNTVRRHRNRIREQTAKLIIENNSETIQSSEQNRYLLYWDEKTLQGFEYVETSTEVIAILLTDTFLCMYYVKPWSKATLPFQAPIEDLNLYKTLLSNKRHHKSEDMRQLSQVAATKLENHFWYLTERLVVFSLLAMLVCNKNSVCESNENI